MTSSTSPAVPVDRDRLMNAIHALQVDLQLLAAWLASESEPVLSEPAIWTLATASETLQRLAPARRH